MYSLNSAKRTFFDRKEVTDRVAPATRKALSRAGAFIRSSARHSIRKRRNPAPPGSPPSSHKGLLKKHIYFSYDKTSESVVVGPTALIESNGTAPSTLEYGGNSDLRKNPRRTQRKTGDSGVVKRGKSNARSSRQVRDRENKLVWVTFGKLRTTNQVKRSDRLETEIWGPLYLGGHVEARPYMGPALEREKPNLPSRWQDTIK